MSVGCMAAGCAPHRVTSTLWPGWYGGRNSGGTVYLSDVGRISLAAKRNLGPCWTL